METQENVDALWSVGCDVAQGYLLSRPMPADQLPDWLARYGIKSAASR